MSRAAEQISESTYYEKPFYWEAIAIQVGGIEVCDDKTGKPLFTIGM